MTGRGRWVAVVAMAVAGLATCGRPSGPPPADLVVRGARIYTVNPERPWATALAVAGDRLVYVGDDAGVDAYVGSATVTVDARGRLVLPGFHDSHVHPISAGMEARQCDLNDAATPAAGLQTGRR